MEIRRRSYGLERFAATCISPLRFRRARPLADYRTRNSKRAILHREVVCLLSGPTRAEDCIASVYSIGDRSQRGTQTASGIPLDNNAMTAAHKSLKFGSKVKVTNKSNGNSVTVKITDRGPYVRGRCIDLTRAGARALGFAGLVVSTRVTRDDGLDDRITSSGAKIGRTPLSSDCPTACAAPSISWI